MSEWIAKLDVYLHDEKCFGVNLLEKIEKKTNCPRKFIVLGLGALVVIWLMVGYGAEFLSNFIGFLYPAYASIKAIESKEKDDDTKWLTYWVVYSSFMLLEFFSDIFLFWIPFYWLLKCAFMVYCFAPAKWNGSIAIYQKIIRPFILKYETKIDDIIDRGVQRAKDGLDEGRKLVEEAESEIAKKHLD